MVGRSAVVITLLGSLGLAACGSQAPSSPGRSSSAAPSAAPSANAADRTFLSEMTPHHERAVDVARIAETRASDPRVQQFARRIVAEQTPELTALRAAGTGLDLDLNDGARHADDRISDTDLAALQRLSGTAFDRRFVTLNVHSEQGANAMARIEVRGGRLPAALRLATAISHSPTEIAQLQALSAELAAPR